MTKDKRINKVLRDDPIPDPVGITSVIVKALDPIYSQYGQRSYGFIERRYGFIVSLDDKDYSFRTNTFGYLALNDDHIFVDKLILAE
jgi:hypothetical protein